LLKYKGDHIYRLLTKSGFIVRASTVIFAAEKRDLKDIKNVKDMLPVKKSYNKPVLKL
jgi:hypothetical protein